MTKAEECEQGGLAPEAAPWRTVEPNAVLMEPMQVRVSPGCN